VARCKQRLGAREGGLRIRVGVFAYQRQGFKHGNMALRGLAR
jgi:hypothetical protein